jgi:predicted dithiol-disulfide oxidoreductase (DUF899 family)
MTDPLIVGDDEWLDARRTLLAREKELTRLRDAVARERRALPWRRVATPYTFEAPEGRVGLADLFGGRGQLLVYHFMYGPDYSEGCPSCSFWADNFEGIEPHLAARDTTLVMVSRGPLEALEAYRRRMGWNFRWVSSAGSDFNFDFAVSRRPGEKLMSYNYGTISRDADEHPGISAFVRRDHDVFHTYSTYARGLDALNGAYQLLDLTARGRQEDGLSFPMAWLRRHDRY